MQTPVPVDNEVGIRCFAQRNGRYICEKQAEVRVNSKLFCEEHAEQPDTH